VQQHEIKNMLRHRFIAIGDDLSIACRGWQEPICCALKVSSLCSEAAHTSTFLASAYAFDATSTRELRSRPQSQSAMPLSIAEYQSSALAHTVILIVACCGLIVGKPRPSIAGKPVPLRCGRKTVAGPVHLGSEQKITVSVSVVIMARSQFD
jgi:hypothetical protein